MKICDYDIRNQEGIYSFMGWVRDFILAIRNLGRVPLGY